MMKSELLDEYKPYSYMLEFHKGWEDYMDGKPNDDNFDGVAQQAYDRGREAAMRWHRR